MLAKSSLSYFFEADGFRASFSFARFFICMETLKQTKQRVKDKNAKFSLVVWFVCCFGLELCLILCFLKCIWKLSQLDETKTKKRFLFAFLCRAQKKRKRAQASSSREASKPEAPVVTERAGGRAATDVSVEKRTTRLCKNNSSILHSNQANFAAFNLKQLKGKKTCQTMKNSLFF